MKKVKRLFSDFRPEHYEISLEPNREQAVFTGTVKLTGHKAGRPSRRITLHQKGLKISGAKVSFFDKRQGKIDVPIERINLHSNFDEVRLHSPTTLFPGRYEIVLNFSGKITEHMHGIYPCNFELGGKPKQLIATQFESHYAREVFPCIDEPEAKATFDLNLLTPKGETVIANTPIMSTANKGKLEWTKFETTPKMSTYLLAFAYGELGYKETKTRRGVKVRAYATPSNVKHTDFALKVARDCLDFYEDYFGIEYPLPKLDMVALPDFSSGAMENWGLVTYRETAMLVDSKNTSLEMQQYVAMVIAHELAHQWFGNLVTMRWWTDLWLNEGFASWIEYLAVDKLFPEWKMWTQYIASDQLAGLRADALLHTHPVEVPIKHPDEIRTIFDDISYQKGSSVIHMLQAYLGADDFKRGLHSYLTKHSYANAVTKDLWHSLAEASGKNVEKFMGRWTSEPGYPLLFADFEEATINLRQHRFLMQPDAKALPQLWPIPLNKDFGIELLEKELTTISDSGGPVVLNKNHSGFYVTVYNKATYARLGEQIQAGKLSEPDRLGLVNDTSSAARAGHLAITDTLELLSFYNAEESAAVWDSIAVLLGDIRRVFCDDGTYALLKPFVRKLTDAQYKRLGWEARPGEDHFDSLLRPTILGLASWGENSAVVEESLARFQKMSQPEDEHPDLRAIVYNTAARLGDHKEFDKLLTFYTQTDSASEKVVLTSALTNFEQPSLYKKALSLIKSDAVRAQDISYWVSFSFSNRHSKQAAWDWLRDNWDWVHEKVGAELGFSRMPAYAARAFTGTEFRQSFQTFFEAHLSPALDREYKKGLETIDWQTAWHKRDLKNLHRFLKSRPDSR